MTRVRRSGPPGPEAGRGQKRPKHCQNIGNKFETFGFFSIFAFGFLTREPPEDLGRIGGIRSHLVLSKTVGIGSIFDPFVIGGKFLIFCSFGSFLASDGLGTRWKRFLGPVSPPVHLSGGRRTQTGPFGGHVWVWGPSSRSPLKVGRIWGLPPIYFSGEVCDAFL